MPVEIERKFLVTSDAWRPLVTTTKTLRQAYLAQNDRASMRIRITDGGDAWLTIKSREPGQRRLEFEYVIPNDDARELLELRDGAVIAKVRHIVPFGDLSWEIDVFEGDNSGLVLAEIELPREDYPVALPAWIGREVTQDGRYYNSYLASYPFALWPQASSAT